MFVCKHFLHRLGDISIFYTQNFNLRSIIERGNQCIDFFFFQDFSFLFLGFFFFN